MLSYVYATDPILTCRYICRREMIYIKEAGLLSGKIEVDDLSGYLFNESSFDVPKEDDLQRGRFSEQGTLTTITIGTC